MKYLGLVLGLLGVGCMSGTTAYRAHFDSASEVAGVRECAARCEADSARGDDVHACLASCPGFSAHPGDRCTWGAERPGTFCVTVQDRLVPDAAFWGAVASAAVDAALEDESENDDDSSSDSGSPSRSSDGTPATRSHSRATPSVGSSSPRRNTSSRERRR